MDSALLLDVRGNLFRVEPPNEKLTQISDGSFGRSDEGYFDFPGDTKLNRVSNCSWCFWSITADFAIRLFVYKPVLPIQVLVCSYENQVHMN